MRGRSSCARGQSRAVCARLALSRAQHRRWCACSCACPSLSCTRPTLYSARKPGLWVATGNPLSQHHPCKPCRDIKSSVTTGMAQPWENTVSTQGDPYRYLSTQSQPQTLSRHKTSVTTWGKKSLSRQRKPLSPPKPPNMPGNPVATRRSLSRHRARKLCRTQVLAVSACLS